RAAARRFSEDHIGSGVGEELRRHRAGRRSGQVDDDQTSERINHLELPQITYRLGLGGQRAAPRASTELYYLTYSAKTGNRTPRRYSELMSIPGGLQPHPADLNIWQAEPG